MYPQLCVNNTVEDMGLVIISSLDVMEMEIHTLLKEALGWASRCSKEGNIKMQNKTTSYKMSILFQVSDPVDAWGMLYCTNRPLLAPAFPGRRGLEIFYG